MKLKTYFMTLMLFLLFFNGSILIISFINLNSNLNSIRESCKREHYFIANSYAKDLSAVESRGASTDGVIEMLFKSYVSYYGKKNVFLEISMDGKLLYSSMPYEKALSERKDSSTTDKRVLSTVKSNGKEYISVNGTLAVPFDDYKLTYLYDLSENIYSWNKVTGVLLLVGIVISLLLAFCLILLLNYIFKPLAQISLSSQKIASGEYENRINIKGKNELSEMAQSFNNMAAEIQNQMDQLVKSAEQKQCFIDNFAHELRTPLTTIYGYAEYIQKAAATEDEKLSAAGYIMSESRRLQNMAYRLLDLATLRNDEITFTSISICDLFSVTVEELKMKALKKQVNLEYTCQFESLTGDFELLRCMLINLADNGIKACGTDGTVNLEATYEENKKVINVKDNGLGITKEHISHITEAFYRVDKSRSRSEGGVGLGLSLCEQIAARHYAVLSFSSEPGKGTTAKITFTNL